MRVEIDALPEALDDLEIAVVTSVTDQLVLANPTADVVEILDDEGTPFLRIGDGIVEANTSSPGWYLTNNPFGLSDIPEDLPAQPEWATVAAEPSWGWFDHRLHPPDIAPPPELVESGRSGLIARWTVPVRFRGDSYDITGSIFYRPIRGTITAELRDQPQVDGLTVAILQGRVPGIFLDNTSGRRVVVLGAEGEPFLRFGDEGVEANVHSPSWATAQRAEGGSLRGIVVDADREPRWRNVADVPRFGWIDPRLGFPEEDVPVDVIEGGVTRTLGEWTLPLRVAGSEVAASGVTTWTPVRDAAGDPDEAPESAGIAGQPWARAALLAAAVVALAMLWRRSGRQQAGGSP